MRTDARTRRACALLLAAACLFGPPAAAANCEIDEVLSVRDKLGGLDRFAASGCMGENADPSAITQRVAAGLAEIKTDARTEAELAERRDALVALLDEILLSLSASDVNRAGQSWQSHAAVTLGELREARSEIVAFEPRIPAAYWSRIEYGFFEQPTTGDFLIDYEADVDGACGADAGPADCRAAVGAAIALIRHVRLVERVLANQVRERLSLLHAELVTLDGQWEYYFEKARSQYYWEFIANNAIYDPPDDELARPPAGQLILFHPTAAMEFAEGNNAEDDAFNAIGIVEVLGYNRLRWGDAATYSAWPVGGSFVVTWSPAVDGDNWGYGAMLHVRNDYSFGATRRDTGSGTETTWLFSVDLTKLFLEKSEQRKRLFRRLDP